MCDKSQLFSRTHCASVEDPRLAYPLIVVPHGRWLSRDQDNLSDRLVDKVITHQTSSVSPAIDADVLGMTRDVH